ncbi:hypothetical protein ACH4GP_19180 [Streptomyces celluloflavus]|uniref:Uncharacterized protein n=1 Tax=Streptomyces celluloflavus TaxID=58344 RepID=A0ABW7REM4_9ACTN
MEQNRAALRAANGGAPPGFPEVEWSRWPDWSIWTNFANYTGTDYKKNWTTWNAWTPSADTGEEAMADQCRVGQILHRGGPQVKTTAIAALGGNDAERHRVVVRNSAGKSPLDLANDKDWATAPPPPGFETEQQQRWKKQLSKFGDHSAANTPEADTETRKFRRASHDRTAAAIFADLVPRASKDALNRVTSIIDEAKGSDEYFKALAQFQQKLADLVGAGSAGKMTDLATNMSADDARLFLQYGGFPKKAPEADSVEFRTETEALKIRWANCDPENPADPYRVLTDVVATARSEWQAELSGQAKFRNDIVAAEAQAYDDMWNASTAMVEAVGQAWIAEQILEWQRDKGVLTPAQKKLVDDELKNVQSRIAAQIALAQKYTEDAKAQSGKVDVAQAEAAKVADTAGAPRGRGLAYAQQSAQVVKGSGAAAEAAWKASETALLAAKATVANAGALLSRAKTEAHALEAQYRRVAAQESAAQAKAAADSAAQQANEAGKAAARAKEARERGEKAEATAKQAAADAAAKRKVAESERATAAEARKKAEAERAKASVAETRAKAEESKAHAARERADSAGQTASTKRHAAEAAEDRSATAREEALEAEKRKESKVSRARALEAAAAAAQGTADAGAARTAATEARAAADEATSAAGRARTAADEADEAATAARAAATEATGAARRARSAADGAEADAATTRAQVAVAHSAAADAIDASRDAAEHVRAAEAFARTAAAKAVQARADAAAARAEVAEAQKESARTAGYAFATSRFALATRDAALSVVDPANEAISLGSQYQEIDASAGMAVLVGQSAKELSEQQADAAKAKAADAAKQAEAAKAAVARATADAKLAAQAAAEAAESAVRAGESVAKARAFAAAAAKDAKAAKTAEANTQECDRQAHADALLANSAATAAEGDASAAWNAATDAEKDAAGARTAAGHAESEAGAARNVADQAERDATAAEQAAANSRANAKEAQEAATRAEEQERQDEQARRTSQMGSGGDGSVGGGTELTSEEERVLEEQCGRTCVEDYRKALALAGKNLVDWLKENGAEILLEVIGIADLKRCFGQGDPESCLWTLVNAASLVVVIGKLPAVTKAVIRVSEGIAAFFEASSWAKRTLERLRTIIERAKNKPEPEKPTPGCLALRAVALSHGSALRQYPSAAMALGSPPRAADCKVSFPDPKRPRLGSDGKYHLKEGDTDQVIDLPSDVSRTITDIDRIKDGVLWEEKTAVSDRIDIPKWVDKQVELKIRKYIEARKYISGYENAPIGLMFTDSAVVKSLRAPVEQRIRELRAEFPGVDIRLSWPA